MQTFSLQRAPYNSRLYFILLVSQKHCWHLPLDCRQLMSTLVVFVNEADEHGLGLFPRRRLECLIWQVFHDESVSINFKMVKVRIAFELCKFPKQVIKQK